MKKDQKLYAVMGTEELTGYHSSKDTATYQKIVVSHPDLFKHGEAYLSAYQQHKNTLQQEKEQLEAKKDPIDQRLREIQNELTAIRDYTRTIEQSIAWNVEVPFLAQDDYEYRGSLGPGSYNHLQKIETRPDGTRQIRYSDDEHQVEPEVAPETEPA